MQLRYSRQGVLRCGLDAAGHELDGGEALDAEALTQLAVSISINLCSSSSHRVKLMVNWAGFIGYMLHLQETRHVTQQTCHAHTNRSKSMPPG